MTNNIRQFSMDGIHTMLSCISGYEFVYEWDDTCTDNALMHYNRPLPECGRYLLPCSIKFSLNHLTSFYKEIPQDKLFFQSEIVLKWDSISENKKCSCEMSDLLRYGCKCGGV